MKIITIQKTKTPAGKSSYCANVNLLDGATACGKNQIEALELLLEKLKNKNPKWIQRCDWESFKKEKK